MTVASYRIAMCFISFGTPTEPSFRCFTTEGTEITERESDLKN
jgi:hypothetical protein